MSEDDSKFSPPPHVSFIDLNNDIVDNFLEILGLMEETFHMFQTFEDIPVSIACVERSMVSYIRLITHQQTKVDLIDFALKDIVPQLPPIIEELELIPSAHLPDGGVISICKITLLELQSLNSYLSSVSSTSLSSSSFSFLSGTFHPISVLFVVYAFFHSLARYRMAKHTPSFSPFPSLSKLIPLALVVIFLAKRWNKQRRQEEIKVHAERLNVLHQMWTLMLFVVQYNRARQDPDQPSTLITQPLDEDVVKYRSSLNRRILEQFAVKSSHAFWYDLIPGLKGIRKFLFF